MKMAKQYNKEFMIITFNESDVITSANKDDQ
eukprot:CAMPEP_0114662030 /NCGR_PEP_ID=MMETSP0191-20121206/23933_1 /TAXON_ID=126664 /ORGANISM="Sorites sp." /LENGTH=30 /DNA_ID= /DNA_START= /DNA_END= /DNA_ORIENTATION=